MTRLDALFNYLGNYFWKTSPKWSKILGNFWNGTTFCHLGHFDLITGDLFPNEPHGHTVWYQVGIWFWSPIPGETSRAPVRIPNEELVKLVDFFLLRTGAFFTKEPSSWINNGWDLVRKEGIFGRNNKQRFFTRFWTNFPPVWDPYCATFSP